MKTSAFQQAIHHAYAQTDGTYAWPNSREGDMLREAKREIEHLRGVVTELAALAQHSDSCSWILPLPTGEGFWGCDCGLDRIVLDGELNNGQPRR